MKMTNVNEYIDAHPDWKSTLEVLHRLILSSGLAENIKWGIPVYSLAGKNVVGLAAFKSYAGLWFYNGALLDDHAKVLINAQPGKTQAMRQWRFSADTQLDKALITHYLHQAIDNQKQGKVIKAHKGKPLELPELLKTYLALNPLISQQFELLTLSKQRDYAEFISTAKREATKSSRLEKIIPMIAQGIGLNDKYR